MISFDAKSVIQYIQKDKKLQWLFRIAIASALIALIANNYKSIVTPTTEKNMDAQEEAPGKASSEININSPKIQGEGNEVNINSSPIYNNIDYDSSTNQSSNSK